MHHWFWSIGNEQILLLRFIWDTNLVNMLIFLLKLYFGWSKSLNILCWRLKLSYFNKKSCGQDTHTLLICEKVWAFPICLHLCNKNVFHIEEKNTHLNLMFPSHTFNGFDHLGYGLVVSRGRPPLLIVQSINCHA